MPLAHAQENLSDAFLRITYGVKRGNLFVKETKRKRF